MGCMAAIPEPFGGNLIHDSLSVEPSGAEAPAMSVRREPAPPPESTNQPTTRMRSAFAGPTREKATGAGSGSSNGQSEAAVRISEKPDNRSGFFTHGAENATPT